jgi:hypothetical protein
MARKPITAAKFTDTHKALVYLLDKANILQQRHAD